MKDRINEIIRDCVAEDIKDKYSFRVTAKGYSANLYANSLINIDISLKNVNRLIFRNNDELVNFFPFGYEVVIKKDEQNNATIYQIDIPTKEEDALIDALMDLREVLVIQQEFIFESHPADYPFGCCSHYLECSNIGTCIMYAKDRPFYKGCSYKENLEQGKVFYGDKRNV